MIQRSCLFCILSILILIIGLIIPFSCLFKDQEKITNDENNTLDENEGNFTLNNLLKEQNVFKSRFMKLLDLSRIGDSYSDEKIKRKINKWKNSSYPYMDIERFSIPIISTVSAGKSSFLNFLLNLENNKLQIGESITTKFCVIIRHKKGEKKGKIYKVIVKKRADINKYNLYKGEEIKEDIKTYIENKNDEIKNNQKENKEIKDLRYFVILEIDTGLFEGEDEKYSQLVEFIDIPGLNEIGVENNFYFKNVLPYIKMNFLFPIIILDATKFESADVFKVFKAIFEPYISFYYKESSFDRKTQYDIENQEEFLNKVKNNSFFIINKLNLNKEHERESKQIKIIKESSSEFNVKLNLGNNCFIINAKAKNLEVNKYLSFLNYTDYIINRGELEENTEIIDILAEAFKLDFDFIIPDNIKEISKKSPKSKGYEEFIKIIKDYNILVGNFKESYFNYFNEKFKEFIGKNMLKMDSDGNKIKIEIKNKITNMIDNLLDITDLQDLLKDLKIEQKELENEDFFKYIKTENPLELINVLEFPIKELKKIGFNNLGVNQLNNDYYELTKFIESNKFIHYIISGIFSSGKSFTLNNIIGHNLYLLETGTSETTSHAFIVRNSEEINFYQAVLVKNKFGYFFNKTKKLASGKKNVIEKIKYVNHNVKKFSFYILETPIQMFENIDIPQEIINSIEIIDYPGLDTTKAIEGNYANNSLFNKDIINGFFFVNEPKNHDIDAVKKVFKTIINKFIYKDSNVNDAKNCLFLFTKNNDNEQSDFYKLDIKEQIQSMIEKLKKEMDSTDIQRIESKMNESLINFVKFSNIDYKHYIDVAENLTSFEVFISSIINIKMKRIKKGNFESLFESLDSYITDKYGINEDNKNNLFNLGKLLNWFTNNKKEERKESKYHINDLQPFINTFKNELVKINFINKNYIFDENKINKIRKYAENYIYLKANLKSNKYYNNSFYEDFENKVAHIMSFSKSIILNKFNNYLNEIITEAKGVFNTVNKKFTMNQTEFEKKFSENVKINIIESIIKKFDYINEESEGEIKKMKEKISLTLKELDCNQNDPSKFLEQFKIIKIKVNTLIDSTSFDIENIYIKFRTFTTKLINGHIIDEYESKKNQIELIESMKLNGYFHDVNFEIMSGIKHFFKNIFGSHDYKDDIKKACKDYEKMINFAYESIEIQLNEQLKDLRDKGIELIKIIFDTANSNFEELQKNFKRYDEINKLFQNLLKNNNL